MRKHPVAKARVTVTLPSDLLEEIDRQVKNRSSFILEAVRRELERRRLELLQKSLESPHCDSKDVENLGFEDWVGASQEEPGLLDFGAGRNVRWNPGEGWAIQE